MGGDPEADGDPNLPAQSPIARRSGGWCLADQRLMHFEFVTLHNLTAFERFLLQKHP